METPTLLVMAAMNLAAVAFFLLTAKEVSKRPFSPETRMAGTAFIASWCMLAVMAGTDALRLGVASMAAPDLPLYATLARVKIIATAIMIAGFGYYVAYLWTGRRRAGVPIVLFAVSHGLFFLYMVELRDPSGIAIGTWGSALVFANPPMGFFGSPYLTFAYYFAPPVILAFAFLSLIYLWDDPRQRLRAVATGSVVIGYHAIGILLYSPQADLGNPVNPFAVGLIASAAVFAWVVHRKPDGIVDPSPAPGPAEAPQPPALVPGHRR